MVYRNFGVRPARQESRRSNLERELASQNGGFCNHIRHYQYNLYLRSVLYRPFLI